MTHRKNPAAVALGKLTSAKKALSSAQNARRATKARLRMPAEQRQEQARRAAYARWRKK